MALAAALAALAMGLAVASLRSVLSFIPSLNVKRPALADFAPVVGANGDRLARRVVLVVVDGLRLDTSYGRPYLDRLRARGVDAQARVGFPTLSRPNYVTLMTGVEPRWSGVRSNDWAGPVSLDSLAARARAAGLRVTYVSDHFAGIPEMFGSALDDGAIAPWPGGVQKVAERSLARGDDLLILLFSEVDEAGHRFGAASPQYREAARRVDGQMTAILGSLDLTQDAVVVVADHGHIDRGGHGGLEPEVENVPLVLAGAGIRPGAVLSDARLRDVAPTVAALLGIPAPGHSNGHILLSALELPAAARATLTEADRARLARIDPVLEQLEAAEARDLLDTRSRRVPLAIAALAILLAFTVLAARRRWVIVDRRVLLIAVPSFPLVFYGAVMAFDQFLSPSMMPSAGSVVQKLFGYGAVAALAHLLASGYALNGRTAPRERLAAASGLFLVGLVVAVAPALAAWAFAGETLTAMLPGPRLLMLPPVTYSVVSCYAFAAALTLVIEYVVFVARASDPLRSLAR